MWNKKRDQEFGAEASSSGRGVEESAVQFDLGETDWAKQQIVQVLTITRIFYVPGSYKE
jgi:hypothetical protein